MGFHLALSLLFEIQHLRNIKRKGARNENKLRKKMKMRKQLKHWWDEINFK